MVEWTSFARDLPSENSQDSNFCFQLAVLHLMLYFFFLCGSPSCSLCTFFVAVPSDRFKILSVKPPNKLVVFGDFNVHSKDWLTNFSGIERTDLKPPLDNDFHFHTAAFLGLFLSFERSIYIILVLI